MSTRSQDNTVACDEADAAVIVAHPDDEMLWAGGMILMHPTWCWSVATLCRGSDPDRAPKFKAVMDELRADGVMADLDDGPEQTPLDPIVVQDSILSILRATDYDVIITHSPFGEYTRHRRHEETGRTVLGLWEAGRLSTKQLWMFAYEDGCRRHLPRPIPGADKVLSLPDDVWRRKHSIIMDIYGFRSDSFEARTVSRKEAFWVFDSSSASRAWVEARRKRI